MILSEKKSVFAETYKIRWSVAGFSFSSLGSSVGASPSFKRTFFTFCNGHRNSLLSTRTNCFRRSARLNLDLLPLHPHANGHGAKKSDSTNFLAISDKDTKFEALMTT